MATDGSSHETGSRINRRQVLKAAGAAGASLVMFSGSASAHSVFYGCSQVCTEFYPDEREELGDRKAVVDTGDGCECRPITRKSNRNDPLAQSLKGDIYCYEVESGDEAIVGMCNTAKSAETPWHPNVNNCADQKADCDCDTCGQEKDGTYTGDGTGGGKPEDNPGRGN